MSNYLKAATLELGASSGERRFANFLKRNSLLLVEAFNTGNNTILVCPEFRFGNRFRADFVVLSGCSSSWDVHLVELEPVGSRIFLADGTESKALRQAKKQVADWDHYITSHRQEFREELASSVVDRNLFRRSLNRFFQHNKREITDTRYGFYPYYHIVIGRRSSLSEDDASRRSGYLKFNHCALVTYDRFLDEAANLDELERQRKSWRAKNSH